MSCPLVLAAAGTAAAQAVWTGPSGGGMMAVQEAQVLEPGHFAFGLVMDNYDRDPLGLDVFDVRVDWRLAIVHRVEIHGRYHISRAVSEPGADPVPPPPVDLVALKASPPLRPPYRAMYWPMPYLRSHPGAQVSDMTPGEYAFGLKVQLANQRGWQPALVASAEISAPGDTSRDPLERGSGSGSVDLRLAAAATWEHRRLAVSVNAGYTRNQDLSRADRLVIQDDAGRTEVIEEPISRPGFLQGGLGVRVRIWRGISALAEVFGWAPVGVGTSTLDGAGAGDLLGGVQITVKGVSLTAGFRQHLETTADGTAQFTGPLAGSLDLSSTTDAAQRRYLESLGVDERVHRPDAGLVVVGLPQGAPTPPGSRRIPDTYQAHTSGNGGMVAAISFSF